MSLFYLYYFEVCVSICFSDCLKLQLSKKTYVYVDGKLFVPFISSSVNLLSVNHWSYLVQISIVTYVCVCAGLPQEQTSGVEPRISGLPCRWEILTQFPLFFLFPLKGLGFTEEVMCWLFFLFFFSLSVWNYPCSHVSVEYINWIYFLWSIFCCL